MPAHLIKTCTNQHSHNNIKCVLFTLKNILLLNFSTNRCFKMVYLSKIEHFFHKFFYTSKFWNFHTVFQLLTHDQYNQSTGQLHLRFEDFTAVTVFCNVTHCSRLQLLQKNLLTPSSIYHMGLAGSSEKLVTSYQNTWHHMLELQETAQFGKKAF